MRSKKRVHALAYLRTPSAAAGTDRHVADQQRRAIEAFARYADYLIVGEYSDAAPSSADPIEGRPGFKALLERVDEDGVSTVIVEDASCIAAQKVIREAGIALLVGLGARVLTATGKDLTASDDEVGVAMRQLMGVFAEHEKARLAKKLQPESDRGREKEKVQGRKSRLERLQRTGAPWQVIEALQEAAALARRLRRTNPRTGKQRSLRTIARELADAGHFNERGKPYDSRTILHMIRRK